MDWHKKVSVAQRAGNYDQTGALRDMFQNHLLQLVILVVMERIAFFDADYLRNEKVTVRNVICPSNQADIAASRYWGCCNIPEADDRLCLDALKGEARLFERGIKLSCLGN